MGRAVDSIEIGGRWGHAVPSVRRARSIRPEASSSPVVVGEELANLPEWQLAQRIARSKIFSRSELLPRFLLYVCERHLTGRTQEITETQIGIHVFQRPPSYNPAEDNIVRSYARSLRRKLEEYFRGEGSHEPMRIVIPRGGYSPVFEPTQAAHAGRKETIETHENPDALRPPFAPAAPSLSTQSGWQRTTVAALGGLIAGVLLVFVCALFFKSPLRMTWSPTPPPSAAHVVWKELFQSNRDTLLVPADSGLGIWQNFTRQQISLANYMSADYIKHEDEGHGFDAGSLNDLRTQQYTSVVDLNIVFALAHLSEFDSSRARIRSPHDVSTNDLKNSNVVLVGSVHSNPWVGLFEKQTNFHLMYLPEVDRSYVANDHPEKGEQPVYRNEAGSPSHLTYAAIDYLPNLNGSGHVLIIQGLTMAGTQAAADLLLHSKALQPVLQRATLPDGSLQPFEVLIETSTIGADSPAARVIATRIHPA